MKSSSERVLIADALLLLTAAIWGSGFIAQRIGMDYIEPFGFNGFRFLIGGLVLLPLINRDRNLKNSINPHYFILPVAVCGLVLFAAASLQQAGLVYTTAGKAGFLTSLYVVMVPIFSLFFGYKPGAWVWAGSALAIIGLFFLSPGASMALEFGDLLVFISAIFWAIHVLAIDFFLRRGYPLVLAAGQFFVCGALSLMVAIMFEGWSLMNYVSALPAIAYGGLISVGAGYTLQVVAQRDAPPGHVAIILSAEALFAAIFGWLILSEILSPKEGFGCILLFAGVIAAQLDSLKKSSP